MEQKYITIRGAREHNLKNINVDIPKNSLVVLTGPSGSGKSSLAFDTIYTEGQRRYVESLSAYARQFLGNFNKPDFDSIEGLSPAISIEQKTTSKNPRSTVGTITELYDYFRLLFARIGIPYSPATNLPIEKQSIPMMVEKITNLSEGSKIYLLSPVVRGKKGEYKKELEYLRKRGFQRLRIDGIVYDFDDLPILDKNIKHDIEVVVDRLVVKADITTRLTQSLEVALELSNGIVLVLDVEHNTELLLSEKFSCPVSGFAIEDIEPRLFSFNNPFGACHQCKGLGVESVFDEDLLIPDHMAPLREAIAPWSSKKSGIYYRAILNSLANHYQVDLDTPYIKINDDFKQILLYGTNEKIKFSFNTSNAQHESYKVFEGLIPSLGRRLKETESDNAIEELKKYMTDEVCSVCHGKRLNQKALQVKIDQYNIYDVTSFSIKQSNDWLSQLQNKLTIYQQQIAEKILLEIKNRLSFLMNVGIGYLELSRKAGTLSGGESQRIRLASQIGSGLTGVLYVLDEPSIGLHQRDNDKLIETLLYLKNLGNTVIVVEHDEDTILNADFIVDMGPNAGEHGGDIIVAGDLSAIKNCNESLTGKYLRKELSIEVPKKRRSGNGNYIELIGAKGNNLKNVDVKFPLGCFICVSGISGSGKSTLINDTLYKAIAHEINNTKEQPDEYEKLCGLEYIDKVINIDQSPIGRLPSSNPATYTKIFDHIRELFALLPEAKARGYKAGRFSFNVKGGRCEKCKGDGVLKVEMHFLPDVYITCDECKGKRYNAETLEIKWNDYNIADILNMTVDQVCSLFMNIPAIYAKLVALKNVGLGYIRLGQSAVTFSGGEAQRIKLAKELSKKSTGKTLYILDEPTTGLHFHDVKILLDVLQCFVDSGNTILVIEHNLDVLKVADYMIDVGPEGGELGGYIVATGTPEDIASLDDNATGKYLRRYLAN